MARPNARREFSRRRCVADTAAVDREHSVVVPGRGGAAAIDRAIGPVVDGIAVERRCVRRDGADEGFAGGQLFLLQSRPITTIPPRWTRDESAERFPNVITPLTWDFVDSGFHRSLHYSFGLMGFPPFNGKWFGMHGHYIYGNQNAVELYGRRAPFLAQNLEELRAAIPKLREEFRWVQELPVAWARDLDFYLISIGRFMAEPLADKSLGEVWGFVRAVNEHGAGYFLPNIAISITQSTLYRLLHRLLQMDHENLEADLD